MNNTYVMIYWTTCWIKVYMYQPVNEKPQGIIMLPVYEDFDDKGFDISWFEPVDYQPVINHKKNAFITVK